LLSAATLTFEISLTRLFSVTQFYHFAFMIVSLALLGFGASGTALALFPGWVRGAARPTLASLSLGAGVSMLAAYFLVNWLPFDSFSMAWEPRQLAILFLHYLALAVPFFFCGLAVGSLLAADPGAAGRTYAVNLLGSALGCGVALVTPALLGGEGALILSSGLAAAAALIAITKGNRTPWRGWAVTLLAACLVAFALVVGGLRAGGADTFPFLDMRLSPYKSLSYALQYPGASITSQHWNAFSRVDVVASPGIRSLPGLSIRYPYPPPPEQGLLVDGDDLNPIILPGGNLEALQYLPAAAVYRLRPQANVLVLEPRGGLDVLTALEGGARQVTAVEPNPLAVAAAPHIYTNSLVRVVNETGRSYLRRTPETFDVVVLSLTSAYHPIRSGAYSLGEDYRYTVEAFQDALVHLEPEGVFVVTRWLQTPPSEWLRAFALVVTALEELGVEPDSRLAAFRGYNTGTIVVKATPLTPTELEIIRGFTNSRAFDLVYVPGISSEELNRFNILPEPVYYQTFNALLTAPDRETWYASYAYEVTPPTDDRPFFGHFFKWSQAPQILSELGKTWQPFGGAGYFVLLALLALAVLMAGLVILLPVAAAGRRPGARPGWAGVGYFGLIGLAFLLVEIPLIQGFILYLGQPAYALTAVLFALLFFSGLGSRWADRLDGRLGLGLLVLVAVGLSWLLPEVFLYTLGFPFGWRLVVAVAALAPVGLLMGGPFPRGVRAIEEASPGSIPWMWGVNGAASVVASVLAALLVLSWGLRVVLWLGAACYAGAWLVWPALTGPRNVPPPR